MSDAQLMYVVNRSLLFTEKEARENARLLYLKGYSYKVIGKQVGRSRDWVALAVKRWGWKVEKDEIEARKVADVMQGLAPEEDYLKKLMETNDRMQALFHKEVELSTRLSFAEMNQMMQMAERMMEFHGKVMNRVKRLAGKKLSLGDDS